MVSINGTGMKRAVLINDLSCIGKCSLSVAMPIISAYGAETVPLPTEILSTHTGGFENYVVRDMTEEMSAFIAHWKSIGAGFDCIYTGFFCSVEQMKLTEQFIRDFSDENTLVIVDPVLGDWGELYGCFSDSHVEAMRSLCALADVITPNVTEAALLTGCGIETPADELLKKLNVRNAVITGVRSGENIGYLADFSGNRISIEKEYLPIRLHGTGDVFASSFCGELLNGKSYRDALIGAADFCAESIEETSKRLPAHWYGLAFEDVLKRRMKLS